MFVMMLLPFLPNSLLHLKTVTKQRAEPLHLWSLWTLNLDAVLKSLRRQIFGSWLKCPEEVQLLGWGLPRGPAQGAGEEEKIVLTSQSYCSHFLLHPTCTERPEKSRKLQQAMGKTRIPAGEGEEGRVVRALSIPKHMADTFRLSWKHVVWSWTSWSRYGDYFLPCLLWPGECPQKLTLQYLCSGKTDLMISQMNRILTTSCERKLL